MEDEIDRLYNKLVLSASSILSHLDEFTLFCYYLGFDPIVNEPYLSPIRTDDTKSSFALFYAGDSVRYIDYGTGDKGDIFKFLQKLYGITYRESLELINEDFGLGYSGKKARKDLSAIRKIPVVRPTRTLRVRSKPFTKRGLAFWNQFHIIEEVLKRYNVTEVEYLHFDDEIQRPYGLCFAYQIGKYYKIYQPYNKEWKFINSFPRNYVEGMLQLRRKSDTLIISKSTKDIMCLDVLGFESISPKSESTLISLGQLVSLDHQYKRIYLLFDNDAAGKLNAQKYKEMRPDYRIIFLVKAKDISDHLRDTGIADTRLELTKLLYNYQ